MRKYFVSGKRVAYKEGEVIYVICDCFAIIDADLICALLSEHETQVQNKLDNPQIPSDDMPAT